MCRDVISVSVATVGKKKVSISRSRPAERACVNTNYSGVSSDVMPHSLPLPTQLCVPLQQGKPLSFTLTDVTHASCRRFKTCHQGVDIKYLYPICHCVVCIWSGLTHDFGVTQKVFVPVGGNSHDVWTWWVFTTDIKINEQTHFQRNYWMNMEVRSYLCVFCLCRKYLRSLSLSQLLLRKRETTLEHFWPWLQDSNKIHFRLML